MRDCKTISERFQSWKYCHFVPFVKLTFSGSDTDLCFVHGSTYHMEHRTCCMGRGMRMAPQTLNT